MEKGILTIFTIIFIVTSISAQYEMPVYYVDSYRPAQSGSPVGNTIDGNDTTIYHSDWDIDAIPDTLTFYFSSIVPGINEIKYTPRQSGSNGIWTEVNLLYSTQSDPENYKRLTDSIVVWELNNQEKTIYLNSEIEAPYAIKVVVLEAYNDFSSCAEMRFSGSEPLPTDESCTIDVSSFIGTADIEIVPDPTGSYATSYQPGEGITGSFDGDYSTLYHSDYREQENAFPITMVYHFQASAQIDYLIYHPRSDGSSNGFFGETSIYYKSTASGSLEPLIDYDFGEKGLPVRIDLPEGIQVSEVVFIVKNGANGYASCAEMDFYREFSSSSGKFVYSDIFKTDLYAAVKENVTQAMIDTMSSPFYKSLAQCIFNGTYNHALRVRDYTAYTSLDELSAVLKTSRYNAYENATGIYVEEGQKVVLFVRDISVVPVYLRVRDWADEDSPEDHIYILSEGRNVLTMKGSGLAYISYYSDFPEAAPVRINFTNGAINGYFNPLIHDADDWVQLMTKDIYPKVDIVGTYVHLVYDRAALKQNCPFDGSRLIAVYDSIVNWQKIIDGMYKFNYEYLNRMLAYSETGGGYYAGGLGVHLDLTWGPANITDPDKLDLWGIPHEFGHINQIRPGLKWIGTTEVTNNVNSAWAYYKMNRKGVDYTRMEASVHRHEEGTQGRSGNLYNILIDSTYIHHRALQSFTQGYFFKVLIPFWQLELYYQVAGACRGAAPLTYETDPEVEGIDYAHWYATVAEKVRDTDPTGLTNGEMLLNFVRYTCDAVQTDLTDFFIKTGFLRPIDRYIDDYGVGHLKVTQGQIDDLIAEIKAKYSTKPVSPVINYITALSVNIYKSKHGLVGTIGDGVELVTDDGAPYLLIDQSEWENAVAYESYDSTGDLTHVTVRSTGDLSGQYTYVQYLDDVYKVYAVGYDGERILVYPERPQSTEQIGVNPGLTVFPNPVKSGNTITIRLEDVHGKYELEIYNVKGERLINLKDDISGLNRELRSLEVAAGVYHIIVRRDGEFYEDSFIVQ